MGEAKWGCTMSYKWKKVQFQMCVWVVACLPQKTKTNDNVF